MREIYSVKNFEGRLFIIEWPYHGADALFLPLYKNFKKPCRIVGIAKQGTPEGVYLKEKIKEIEETYDDSD